MKFFKTHSDHELKRIKKTVKQILELQPEYAQLSDEQLKSKTEEFKQRLKEESLNDLLPEAYATIREADKRVLGMEPFPRRDQPGRRMEVPVRNQGIYVLWITASDHHHLPEGIL